MKKQIAELIKKVIAIIAIFILSFVESAFIVLAKEPDETMMLANTETGSFVVPGKEVCLANRAVEVKEGPGQHKQVRMELWGNDISFQRI